MYKPFKPPSFIRKENTETIGDFSEPYAKRQKLDGHVALSSQQVVNRHADAAVAREPLKAVNKNVTVAEPIIISVYDDQYYSVLWRKPTTKKNKTWDGDAFLRITDETAILRGTDGKIIGKGSCKGPLLPGSQLRLGGREVEVDSTISKDEYQRCLNREVDEKREARQEPILIASSPPASTPVSLAVRSSPSPLKAYKKPRIHATRDKTIATDSSGQGRSAFGTWKNPLKENTVLSQKDEEVPTPRHDPTAPDALIMRQLPNSEVPSGKKTVDVVIDPLLSKKLREHQREGVKFLYDCVMGVRSKLGQGAILADDMGLGKTLQTIALIWTLLKQNPIYGDDPVIRKALIVCPVTLIKNWKKEFRKWLGTDRIGVFVADDKRTRITDFTRGKTYSVMIIGYDRLRSVYEELQKGQPIDLIVADEGHRLKTAQSKAAQAIQSLDTPRRIILSGTPIQNNLGEFFSMVDFINPGALGTLKAFTRKFELPIERSRQPGATEVDIERGEASSEELAAITNSFILRRTSDVLAQYLPQKTESVLLCRPTRTQAAVYRHVLASPIFQSALGSAENALQLITILKKVCNSPHLLAVDPTADPEKTTLAPAVASQIPPHLLRHASTSAKLQVLDQLLYTIQEHTDEKVVIVSNFTSTLDVLENLLASLSMPFLRLDGSTAAAKRQDLVDTFNRTDSSTYFAFLLSAKAGGLGINLVGASRLVLFDVDWNPAVDAQAMARIHRDGQRRPCHIYRLLLAGALDEKIWQRQVTKLNLASSVLESRAGQASFTRDELRDLFRLDEGARCQTHELIGCGCGGAKGMSSVKVDSVDALDDPLAAALPSVDVEGNSVIVKDAAPNANAAADAAADDDDDDSDSDLDLLPTTRRARKTGATAGKGVPGAIIRASEIDIEAQERELQLQRRRRGGEFDEPRTGSGAGGVQLDSLMAYSHVDTARLKLELAAAAAAATTTTNQDERHIRSSLLMDDSVLARVLADEESLVSFVFSRRAS